MEVIKNFFLLRWYDPPQKLEKAYTTRTPQTTAKKLQYLEMDLQLPEKFRFNLSQPVLSVLCEDAVMFYTVGRFPLGRYGPYHVLARSRKQHNSIRALVHVLNPKKEGSLYKP